MTCLARNTDLDEEEAATQWETGEFTVWKHKPDPRFMYATQKHVDLGTVWWTKGNGIQFNIPAASPNKILTPEDRRTFENLKNEYFVRAQAVASSETRMRIWHLPRNRSYVNKVDVYVRVTRYRYKWACDVQQRAKRPRTKAKLFMLLHDYFFFVITKRRHPRCMVHALCEDVGGAQGQCFTDLYIKFVLKSEFGRGKGILLKDRHELMERRREALVDFAAEDCARFSLRSHVSRRPFAFRGCFGHVFQRSLFS